MDVLRDVWAEVGFYLVSLGLYLFSVYAIGLYGWWHDRRRRRG